jgi:molybdopterin/thiamine biosynthesis adenylyltransferase/molybdopterin synthase catalytic subunit/rhodanese-related sulfurtransferase
VAGFEFSTAPLSPEQLRTALEDPACGGYATFEGWVRDHNDGRNVRHLEYEAYVELAEKEGERIVAEAVRRFGVKHVRCVHRVGDLALGELAVWVGVSAGHRAEAFAACRYVIDEVKHRVPIWKKEHYADGDSGWVNCERCAVGAEGAQSHEHEHEHERPSSSSRSKDHSHDHPREHSHDGAHPAGLPRPDYSRQVVLPEVGAAGQARIRRARVLVVGAGGLGVPVLQYLAGAGVGVLGIVDGDVLDPSNLHRQTLYSLADVGRPKALLAAERLKALNPEVDVRAHVARATDELLPALAADYDILVDCTDNFRAKFLVNDVAVKLGKIAVLASVYQYEGQLQLVRPGGACLRCLWPDATRDGLVGNCAEAGVLGPVPGTLGSLQALEVLKAILGRPSALNESVLLFDLGTLESQRIRARRASECTGVACVRVARAAAERNEDLEITVESLAAAGAAGYVIVDLREPAEVVAEPAPADVVHIPLARLLENPAQLDDAEARYLLLCARGQRSQGAAAALRNAGRAHVWSLRGGLAGLSRR